MFVSRSEAFKFAVGDVITLPCEVTHPGKLYENGAINFPCHLVFLFEEMGWGKELSSMGKVFRFDINQYGTKLVRKGRRNVAEYVEDFIFRKEKSVKHRISCQIYEPITVLLSRPVLIYSSHCWMIKRRNIKHQKIYVS